MALGVAIPAAPALAGGGDVLPPSARPHGYSLADMAAATAAFNVGPFRTAGHEPDTPFQILFGDIVTGNSTYRVSTGTMLYMPLFYNDNSPPVIGNFPDVTNQQALNFYNFSPTQFGLRFMEVEVDGNVTTLSPGYVVGVITPPLPDGGGTEYITAAVFLTPLTKGTHQVKFRFLAQGMALIPFYPPDGVFSGDMTYTVIVH
jgi:hypothetical protein